MCAEQWAILLELVGFILASFFFAILKVERIKNFADEQKQNIQNFYDKTNETFQMEKVQKERLYQDAIKFLYSTTHRVFILSLKKDSTWQEHKNTLKWFISAQVLNSQLLFSITSDIVTSILLFFARHTRKHEAITNLFIILGTILILSGLVIEFIDAF